MCHCIVSASSHQTFLFQRKSININFRINSYSFITYSFTQKRKMEIIAFYDFVIDSQKKTVEMKNKKDNSNWLKFAQILWTVYGLIHFYFYYNTGNTFYLISGFIGMLWFLLFLLDLNKSYITEIDFNSIQSIEYKNRLLNRVLIIKLKNNKKRFIQAEINKQKMELIMRIFKEHSIHFINKTK